MKRDKKQIISWSWECNGSWCNGANYLGQYVNPLKALIGCLIGANSSASWVCLHFGPCNQWKWRWATTSLFVPEWAWGKTDSGIVCVFFLFFFFLLKLLFDLFEVGTFGIPRSRCVWTLFAGSTVRENRLGLRQNSLLTWTTTTMKNQPDWRRALWHYPPLYNALGAT